MSVDDFSTSSWFADRTTVFFWFFFFFLIITSSSLPLSSLSLELTYLIIFFLTFFGLGLAFSGSSNNSLRASSKSFSIFSVSFCCVARLDDVKENLQSEDYNNIVKKIQELKVEEEHNDRVVNTTRNIRKRINHRKVLEG